MDLSCERSLGFQPEPSSHDWHVQPSCQRTDPLPPERALSVQSRPAVSRERVAIHTNLPVLETCTNYASCATTVNPMLAQDIHLFSTAGEPNHSFKRRSTHATKRIFLSASCTARLCHFGTTPRRKTISLKKITRRSSCSVGLEGLTYRTLRGTLSPNEARGRTDLQELTCTCLMPDERRVSHNTPG